MTLPAGDRGQPRTLLAGGIAMHFRPMMRHLGRIVACPATHLPMTLHHTKYDFALFGSSVHAFDVLVKRVLLCTCVIAVVTEEPTLPTKDMRNSVERHTTSRDSLCWIVQPFVRGHVKLPRECQWASSRVCTFSHYRVALNYLALKAYNNKNAVIETKDRKTHDYLVPPLCFPEDGLLRLTSANLR